MHCGLRMNREKLPQAGRYDSQPVGSAYSAWMRGAEKKREKGMRDSDFRF